MDRRRTTLALVALSAAALLPAAGCSDDDDEADALLGSTWVLREAVVEGVRVYPGPFGGETTVSFGRWTFFGETGCEDFGGAYRAVGTVIEPAEQWRGQEVCILPGYYPAHFDAPFPFELLDGVLTVEIADSTHVYDAR